MAIPLPSGCACRVLILAVLHHYDEEQRARIYAECLRVLRPGGALVVGDVLRGSPQDAWLNGAVNRYNPLGHAGLFFEPSEAVAAFSRAGFERVTTRLRSYAWRFDCPVKRLDFLRRLFYMTLASDAEIESALRETFGREETPGEAGRPGGIAARVAGRRGSFAANRFGLAASLGAQHSKGSAPEIGASTSTANELLDLPWQLLYISGHKPTA
jgi:SAM-dependent methyltransferase